MVEPEKILYRYYDHGSSLARTLIGHSRQVREKALETARRVPHLDPDTDFIAQAAMLHDIGIYQTSAARIGCRGSLPYIAHGIAGRQILEECGLHRHALVCERHVGAGITRHDIRSRALPLPDRDMIPVSIEEVIVCYADKFFSKNNHGTMHTVEEVIAELKRYGADKADRFLTWHKLFSGQDINGPWIEDY